MIKYVYFKLSSIRYSWESIGDDITIEVEALGQFTSFNKEIQNWETRKLNDEIGVFNAYQSSFTLPITLKIIERDLVFNDVGSANFEIKVDLENKDPQKSTHSITVIESRWKFKKPRAYFDIELEAKVIDVIRYMEETDEWWIKVKIDGEDVALPAFLKVKLNSSDSHRDYFTILEGAYQWKDASIRLSPENESYLLTENPHKKPVILTYSISKKEFILNDKIYHATDDPEYPLKEGKYDIEIPDAPHKDGELYTDKATKAKAWFRIGHNWERYIHTWQVSHWCVTLTQQEKWDELYSVLIRARKWDSKSIGVLEVIE